MAIEDSNAVDSADPNKEINGIKVSSAAEIIDAIMNTAVHPDLMTILNDVALVLNLIHKVKQSNGGLHPTAIQILKTLL